MVETKKFSFTGWKLLELATGNKESFKLVIAAALGFWVPVDPQWKLFAAALTKFVLDSIDYWLKK